MIERKTGYVFEFLLFDAMGEFKGVTTNKREADEFRNRNRDLYYYRKQWHYSMFSGNTDEEYVRAKAKGLIANDEHKPAIED